MNYPLRAATEWHDKLLKPGYFLAAVGVHVLLAVVMRLAPPVSKIHAAATLLGCLYAGASGRKPENMAYLLAYVVGCEVLWRMTRGALVYEWGKYAVISILLVTLFRMRQRNGQPLAVMQFLLLVPSSLITIAMLSMSEARDALSFNLSGPLALCLCVMYFSAVRRSLIELQKILLIALIPLCGIAGLTVFNMSTAPIVFTRNSNYWVTGGFGPNQVSAVLGMGLYFAFLLLVSGVGSRMLKLLLCGVLLLLGAQCAMTFSRNGLYAAVGACFLASQFMIADPRTRMKLLIAVPAVALIGMLVIFPYLNDFTGGALGERFEKTSTSGRDDIALRELELWKQNIFFGVGPGMGKYVRGDIWDAAAHTEFTRLVAEHGLLGLGAGLLYGVMALSAFSGATSRVHQGVILSAVGWAFAFMMANAMRLTAPGFVFALACMPLLDPRIVPRIGPRIGRVRSAVPRVGAARYREAIG